jgi:hypothetical protein
MSHIAFPGWVISLQLPKYDINNRRFLALDGCQCNKKEGFMYSANNSLFNSRIGHAGNSSYRGII